MKTPKKKTASNNILKNNSENLESNFQVQPPAFSPSADSVQLKGNGKGLPEELKNVQVHGNSNATEQMGANAYTQGNDINLGTGQEEHLPHEAWHAIQQGGNASSKKKKE